MQYTKKDYEQFYNERPGAESLWKRVSLALAIVALFAVMAALDAADRRVTAQLVNDANARKAVKPSELCIVQYGAGETNKKAPACAAGTTDAPHIFILPVSDK